MKYTKEDSDCRALKEWRNATKNNSLLDGARIDYKRRLFDYYCHWRNVVLQDMAWKDQTDVEMASGVKGYKQTLRTELEMAELPKEYILIETGNRKMGGLWTNTGTRVSKDSARRYNNALAKLGLFRLAGKKPFEIINEDTGEIINRSVNLWSVTAIEKLHRSLGHKYKHTLFSQA